ncbi:MAG: tetratricopeptide repeat-containing sulfotransferase family protein [Asticcacaulis sp.]|uniref:tetratricopeptide repeat-containing sulfotransferase family protein n=1 Tax=Asticcacaulis sp. TaxID=1872648 RepID=UPI003F7C412B
MEAVNFRPRFEQIIAARSALDRRGAARLMREDLEVGPSSGDYWRDMGQFASQLGESGLALEAAKRFAATAPQDMDYVFYYALTLSRYGKHELALAQMDSLPADAQNHPAVLHFRAMAATQMGEFEKAEQLVRRALAISPAPVQWLALSVAKKFKEFDSDILAMEAILPRVHNAPPAVKAQLLYSLGKAYDDAKQLDKAEAYYAEGAALMRAAAPPPDMKEWHELVDGLLGGFSAKNLSELKPSGANGRRMLFVTGFPRSGTTLVEQILTSHSEVCAGAELNEIPVALIPAGDPEDGEEQILSTDAGGRRNRLTGQYGIEQALAYEARSISSDPWGDIGRDYLHMVEERFGPEGYAVDKTLNLGSFMGLTLHMLPNAKVFWLRRRPEDCALSNYRLYSQLGTLPWTYSAKDIAEFFKSEDKLYQHWSQMYPDRIFTVPYEGLVSEPEIWIRRMLDFAGLKEEQQVFEPHKSTRAVSTASMAQVRSPITKARIGAAESYKTFVEEFRRAYYG